ncbi:O-Glycosyl hydrolases family 17 protein isoform 1 [Hibiscus syriacus]|uniref:O-Glycosyl hydrolases family 17 protein isoform 1 n=1 Tax=Hibiscus syriacus TaxID=106335 RepID=A0A6A2WXQ9_HIBSY|nr:O-Glycosyl hydrolases family 17 protein isoform 1 [Hibiscus syriacus]
MDGSAATTAIKFVRDRGLDHAVEREKNLCPLLNVKNLIKSEPSKSLPISIISQNRDSLKIPFRPIEFIRKYPSVFHEFHPGGIETHPHIKLTQEVLDVDADEHLVYESVSYRQLVADRLLKLLMISRMNKIPISILDKLKWDMGLPQNYLKPSSRNSPIIFGLSGRMDLGMPLAFPVKFSPGFEMDKKVKKWWDDWQKLPYVSPYENALHLSPKTDESDKWTAAVLHEILNLFISKKAERDDVLCLGEYLGIRSRGLLIESNPLMNVRNRYLHLMHTVKEHGKDLSASSGSSREKKAASNAPKKEAAAATDDDSEEEKSGILNAFSASETENGDSDDEEDRFEGGLRGSREAVAVSKRRATRSKRRNVDLKAHSRDGVGESKMKKKHGRTKPRVPLEANASSNVHWRSQQSSSNLHQKQ